MPVWPARPLIAVFDDDVAARRLGDAAWRNPREVGNNGVDDDRNGVVDDVNGAVFTRDIVGHRVALGDVASAPDSYAVHGTGVAGIASAAGARVVGVGFLATEDPLRGFERAVDYVVGLRERGEPVRVVNASFGLLERDPAARARWLSAARRLEAAGIVLVCALPNEPFAASRNEVPASLDLSNIIRVGVRTPWGHVTKGADVIAPGIAVPTTTVHGLRMRMSGTSAAAPQVSAAVAAWLDRWPQATPAQARAAIMLSSTRGELDVTRLLTTPPS